MPDIVLDGRRLTLEDLARVAAGEPVALHPDAVARMEASAATYAASGRSVLREKWSWLAGGVPREGDVVRRFVVGHCAGVGEPLPPSVVRASMAARVNALAVGLSGVRPACAEVLVAMLAADVVPVVPSQGSVGAAGDLAPLAHIAQVACRYGGEAWRDGVRLPAAEAMRGLPELVPTEKEALSLINGATVTAAMAALACVRAERLLETALVACALSFEVCRADLGCVTEDAIAARGHPGGLDVANGLRQLLEGSGLVALDRRPDPFSIRCAPAVLGAAWEALDHVSTVVWRELNGACDNPLVLGDTIVEAGNFHGAPVALAMDHLKVALTQVASIAERRTFRMTYGQLTGLPSYLLPSDGLNSGLMLAQYTAASLVSECKGWSHPASVDSIPTLQHREDHVSMGPIAARGALAVVEALADVLAIELLCGAQGVEFHVDAGSGRPGEGTARAWSLVREHVPRRTDDSALYPDLRALGAAVRAGVFASVPATAW